MYMFLQHAQISQSLSEQKRKVENPNNHSVFPLHSPISMAQKRVSPLDEPPTASSSDSEEDNEPSSQEEQPSSEKHQLHEDDEEEEDDSSEEQDEEEEEEDEDEPAKPSSTLQLQTAYKKPLPPSTNSQPRPSYSESATESDSGSDSDDEPPVPAANPKVKPLTSKPMEEISKPRPHSSATPARSASKRPSENNGHVNDSKRAKKKVTDAASDDDDIPATEEDGKKSGDDSKKLFQRLWSEEDEVAILKGMVEFSAKTRGDPLKDANVFHDFIKKSLHADASCNQLKQKIRRLKKKFETNAGKGKNGEGPNFTKPHDKKAFELSKKVWANGVVENAKTDGIVGKSQKEGSRNVASPKSKPKPKAELLSPDSKEPGKMEIDEKPYSTLHLSEMIRFDKGLGLSGLNEDFVKRGVKLIGASKRAELEERWKKLQVAELELYVKRAELIEDQSRLILEAYKKSSND